MLEVKDIVPLEATKTGAQGSAAETPERSVDDLRADTISSLESQVASKRAETAIPEDKAEAQSLKKETTTGDDIPPVEEDKADEPKGEDAGQKKEPTAISKLDPTLLSIARSQNWSDADLAHFASNEQLEVAITALDRRMVERAEKLQASKEEQPEGKIPADKSKEATESTPTVKDQPAIRSKPVQVEPLDLGLDPEVDGENVVKAFDKMRGHYEGIIAQLIEDSRNSNEMLARAVMQTQGFVQRDVGARNMARFDAKIAGLNGPYRQFLGQGDTRRLDPKSEHAKNRQKLIESMLKIEAGENAFNPNNTLGLEEVFDRGLLMAFGANVRKLAYEDLASKEKSVEDMLEPRTRPTGTGGMGAKGERKRVVDEVAGEVRKIRRG